MEQRLLEASAADPTPNGFAAMQRVHAMHRELTSQGCTPGGGPGTPFEAPSSRMGEAPSGAAGTNFEAGRPMVDVGRNRSR